jgi:hypothetical protein
VSAAPPVHRHLVRTLLETHVLERGI